MMTITNTAYSLLAALAIAAPAAVAQTAAAPMSLDDCIDLALRNNKELRMAAYDTRAAAELRREAFTKYFPDVSAAGAWFKTHKDVFQYNVADLFTLGLIDGGTMAGVQAVQPVFMGGQIVNGNRLARVGEEAARLKAAAATDRIRLATEQYYWNLATLQATRSTLVKAIEMLDSLSAQVAAAVEAGVAMKNDMLKVDLQRARFRADLVDADNGVGLVRMLLAQTMGVDTSAVAVEAEVPDSLPPFPMAIYVDAAAALPSTVDFRLLAKNVEAKKIEKRMEIGRNLPTVAVGAGWFYHNLLSQGSNFGAIGVAVAVPLSGWWGGTHAIRRKGIELEAAQTEMADLGEKLEIAMRDKWDNLSAAYRKMGIASEAIAQANENLRLNRAYYDAGIATVTDLLDAETSRKEAMTAYITAYGAFCVARAAYLTATRPAGDGAEL